MSQGRPDSENCTSLILFKGSDLENKIIFSAGEKSRRIRPVKDLDFEIFKTAIQFFRSDPIKLDQIRLKHQIERLIIFGIIMKEGVIQGGRDFPFFPINPVTLIGFTVIKPMIRQIGCECG